jgi:hypothetical protein
VFSPCPQDTLLSHLFKWYPMNIYVLKPLDHNGLLHKMSF